MSTPATPVSVAAPAAPSAPAAPASSPAPSAPVSAPPSAPPAATPPVAPAPPAETPGTSTPAPVSAPYDPKTAPSPPKATDYPNTTDGQTQFGTDMNRWYREHPEGEKPPVAAPPAAEAPKTPEEQALADAQPADAPKPPAAPEIAPTPQALAEMMDANKAFKDVLDANPKEKNAIFKMARELAEVAPIRELFPSVDDAKFAQEYSSNMVGLKTASLRLTSDPESSPQFLEMFDSQFARVDAEGKPILDAAGKPTFDADREAVRGAIFNSRLQEVAQPMVAEIAALETKLKGAYPSDFARTQDQTKFDRLKYAQEVMDFLPSILDGSAFTEDAPEAPADATPEQKQWFENQKADLARQRQELEDKQKGSNKEERAAASQKFNTDVRGDMGVSAGTVIQSALKQIVDSGVYIPAFYMQEKYVDSASGKETGTSAIGARLFLQFENDLRKPGSRTLMDIAQHELLPQNDQTRELRKNWYARKASEIMPGLVQKEVDRIQSLVKLDSTQQEERLRKQREVAQPEPASGGSALPGNASREQVLQAAEEAAKKDPGWESASPSDRQARILTQVHRMGKK